MFIRTLAGALVCVLLLLVIGSNAALAQSRRPVQVALVDSLSVVNARAEIIRFAEPDRADLILLRNGAATAQDLVTAIAMLRASSGRRPTRPGTVARTTIIETGELPPTAADLRQRAALMLDQVRRAPMARIGNLGRGRWSEFDVGGN